MSKPSLFVQQDRLCLGLPGQSDAGVLTVDFYEPSLQHRVRRSVASESLVKAMGSRHPGIDAGAVPTVIDATAGLGQDAFILACAGWQVTLIEQSALVHALLEDGLRRARASAEAQQDQHMLSALQRMQLLPAASSHLLLPTLASPAVIYLDPMFPEREKSARVKKNRYLLQQLHGEEAQGENLLRLALTLTRKVVVKRPQHAEPLDGLKPSGSIRGKTARFDIYAGQLKSINA